MEDRILKLIESLISFTTQIQVKWDVGSEEGEYYLNINGKGILLSSKTPNAQEYSLSLLDSDGENLMTIQIVPSDGSVYEAARKLYNLVSTSTERSGKTIEDIINLINSEIKEDVSKDNK